MVASLVLAGWARVGYHNNYLYCPQWAAVLDVQNSLLWQVKPRRNSAWGIFIFSKEKENE
jgi:hypothetical protein